jgi:hypothetical protein
MVKADSAIWITKFGMTCALLLTCCWVAPRVFKNLPQFPAVTTDEQQVEVFDRYFQMPVQDIVLVGSSLSYRLKERFFEQSDVRNAAIPGGSSLTGLAIIEGAPVSRPRVIAVETNILNRGVDNDLLNRFRNAKRSADTFRPLRTLAAYYQNALDGTLAVSVARRQLVLERPPATYDTERGIAKALIEWNKPIYEEAILRDTRALKSFVEKLEAQGIKIFFYEVPYPPILDQTGYATVTRKTLDQIFGPANNRRLKLEYPAGELRWNDDGAHLDERSAVIVASALANAINKKLADQ